MTDKGMLVRKPAGRAFVYAAASRREQTLGEMVADLLGRAFGGSAASLVTHLLEQVNPDDEELNEIRRTIRQYQLEQKEPSG
jgi:predicted transcriptional regulator